jgi:class 3 adenylate cyclase/tetratricopeptide (TPR) repeat protein
VSFNSRRGVVRHHCLVTEERRLVTVLFADVVGSTTLGETMDPEDVRALLGRLFSIARDAVETRGGRVEKFIGDAVMAVFGLPTAHDDDVPRALTAALDLRDRVRADETLAGRIAIRLAVNTGEVIATRDADASQFLVTGDPVNSAARLQQGAEPWAILVGERSVRAARGRFEFGPPLDVEAKGKAAPLAARPLVGLAEKVRQPRATRIVGRDADLQQLELTARRALEEGRPYLVSIVAPAGVGKSRLLEEFLGRLPETTTVAIAQCLPYGQRLTYWPMRAILLAVVGLPDDATPPEVRDGVLEWLRESDAPDPERTADLLAATIGASEAESGDRLALFAAWREFVEVAAARSPLVLVIEDLHWSSDSLLDLVESILQPKADVPLLMIALARPELLDRRPSWGGGRRNAISLALEPLRDRDVGELVADLLPGVAPEVGQIVAARAEGNPFYAGEIVRTLEERLGPAPDPALIESSIASLPDTVQATVLSRLDSLEPTARRVVQLGAVLGRSFPVAALPALEPGLDATTVDGAIDRLVDRDMVRPSGRGTVTFRHILIREVAYGTLPRSERARLHLAAGLWLERDAESSGREDELAELVAFHLREAINLAGLLGEPIPAEQAAGAVSWLRRAAEVAFGGGANVEAARHLNAAIALAPPVVQADLYERLGVVWSSGDQGLEAFRKAYELGQQLNLGPDQALRTTAQALIVYTRWAGSVAVRMTAADRAHSLTEIERLLGVATSDRAIALGWVALAFRQNMTDQPTTEEIESSRTAGRRALELTRALDDPDLISASLDALDSVEMSDNRFENVPAIVSERLGLGNRLSTGERLDSWIVSAWSYTLLGQLEAAEQAASSAVAGLVGGQAPSWVAGASAWRALALFYLGRWDEAVAEGLRMERSLRESEIRAPWYALNGILTLYLIARARGDAVDADRWRAAAEQIFEYSDPDIRTQRLQAMFSGDLDSLAERVIAGFMLFAGRLDYVALSLAELADQRHPMDLGVLDGLIAYSEERSLHFVSAAALRLRGLIRRDEADLRTAFEAYDRMGARPAMARIRAELGLLADDVAGVEAAIGELEQIGDRLQQARLSTELRGDGWPGAGMATPTGSSAATGASAATGRSARAS